MDEAYAQSPGDTWQGYGAYGAVAGPLGSVGDYEVRKPYGSSLDTLKMFPSAFTLTCGLVFLCPAYLMFWLAHSPVVAYWSSSWSSSLLLIPIILAGVHAVHVRLGVPNKCAVVTGLVVPSVLLLIFANSEYGMATSRADKLFSTDCDTFAEKASLQHSWEAAFALFENCLNATSASSGRPIAKLRVNFRVQDCEEYGKGMPTYGRDWTYLQYLEENHHCAGWCYPGFQLWSNRPSKDDCSTFVSSVFRYFVMPHASQVVILMVVTMFISTVTLILLGPVLRNHGINW